MTAELDAAMRRIGEISMENVFVAEEGEAISPLSSGYSGEKGQANCRESGMKMGLFGKLQTSGILKNEIKKPCH